MIKQAAALVREYLKLAQMAQMAAGGLGVMQQRLRNLRSQPGKSVPLRPETVNLLSGASLHARAGDVARRQLPMELFNNKLTSTQGGIMANMSPTPTASVPELLRTGYLQR